MIDFSFAASSTPAILVLGGILFIFLDQTAKTAFGGAGPVLLVIGIGLSLLWAGVFKKF